MVSLA